MSVSFPPVSHTRYLILPLSTMTPVPSSVPVKRIVIMCAYSVLDDGTGYISARNTTWHGEGTQNATWHYQEWDRLLESLNILPTHLWTFFNWTLSSQQDLQPQETDKPVSGSVREFSTELAEMRRLTLMWAVPLPRLHPRLTKMRQPAEHQRSSFHSLSLQCDFKLLSPYGLHPQTIN